MERVRNGKGAYAVKQRQMNSTGFDASRTHPTVYLKTVGVWSILRLNGPVCNLREMNWWLMDFPEILNSDFTSNIMARGIQFSTAQH